MLPDTTIRRPRVRNGRLISREASDASVMAVTSWIGTPSTGAPSRMPAQEASTPMPRLMSAVSPTETGSERSRPAARRQWRRTTTSTRQTIAQTARRS